jgi:hypothetical protein
MPRWTKDKIEDYNRKLVGTDPVKVVQLLCNKLDEETQKIVDKKERVQHVHAVLSDKGSEISFAGLDTDALTKLLSKSLGVREVDVRIVRVSYGDRCHSLKTTVLYA